MDQDNPWFVLFSVDWADPCFPPTIYGSLVQSVNERTPMDGKVEHARVLTAKQEAVCCLHSKRHAHFSIM